MRRREIKQSYDYKLQNSELVVEETAETVVVLGVGTFHLEVAGFAAADRANSWNQKEV